LRRDYEGARRCGMGFIWIAPDGVQATERDAAENRSVLAAVTELPDLLDILT
jgi:FMN phosphatase YigB (HAD superfamily)